MKSVSLAQALKIKTRLAHNLNVLEEAMRSNNARRMDRVTPASPPDALARHAEYRAVQARMIEVKSKIAAANVGIGVTLETMSQLKAELALLRSLRFRDEVEVVAFGEQVREYTWQSAIPEARRDTMVRELQARINALQDSVDEFNAVTRIELADE